MFYEELEAKIQQTPADDHLFLLGDFNAWVGADYEPWPRSLGHFGVGKLNENSQRLLELCSYYDLSLTNTFFPSKLQHRMSWRHPRSSPWHQLDFVITRRNLLNQVLVTRSYHSTDCDTDHSLMASRISLLLKHVHYSKQKPRPHINFAKAIDETLEDCPTRNGTISVRLYFRLPLIPY